MVDDPEEQQEFLEETYDLALHLLAISNELLEIARIETGHVQINPQPLRLDEILDSTKGFAQSQVRQKVFTLKFRNFLQTTKLFCSLTINV